VKTAAQLFVRWSPDGSRLLTLADDKTARIWNLNEITTFTTLVSSSGQFQTAEWSPDGERLVTASIEGKITLWSKDGAEISSVTKETSSEYKWIRCYFDPSGKRLLVIDTLDPNVYLWNLDGKDGLVPILVLPDPVRMAQWSPDGTQILAVSFAGSAQLLNLNTPNKPIQVRSDKPIRNGTWTPDSRPFFALTDGTLVLYINGSFGTPIASGVFEEGTNQFSFSPDGARVLTYTPYGHVRIRNANGRGIPFVLGGRSLAAGFAHFSANGKRIAITHEDKFAWVWPEIQAFSSSDDEQLWRLTSYCLTSDKRVEILGSSEAQAKTDEQACRDRVAAMSASRPNL
jgi:WD40 repeat protein